MSLVDRLAAGGSNGLARRLGLSARPNGCLRRSWLALPLLLNLYYYRQPEVIPWLGMAVLGLSLLAVLALSLELRADDRHRLWFAVLAGLFAFSSYLRTLSPTTDAGDSLEFQVVAQRLTFAHPPGYPLYTVLGKLFTMLPFADVAYRMNLLSACAGAAAVAVTCLLAVGLTGSYLGGLITALYLASIPAFWSLAVITEVYTLHVLIVASILYCLLRAENQAQPAIAAGSSRWFRVAVFGLGLGLVHHLTTVFLVPVVGGWAWMNIRRRLRSPRELASLAIAFGLGLTPVLYFFLRWPAVSGRPATLAEVVAYVTARSYPSLVRLDWLLHDASRWLVLCRVELTSQFPPPLLAIALVGWLWLVRHRPPWALWLGIVWVAHVAFRAGYNAWDGWVVLLPAQLAVAVCLGCGLTSATVWLAAWLARAIGRVAGRAQRSRSLGEWASGAVPRLVYHWLLAACWTLAFLVPLWRLWTSAPQADRSQGWPPAALGRRILEALPQGASIAVDPQLGSALLYPQLIEGRRPDVRVAYADTKPGREMISHPASASQPVYLWGVLPDPSFGLHERRIGPLIEISERPFDSLRPVPESLAKALGEAAADAPPWKWPDDHTGIWRVEPAAVARARPVVAEWAGTARLLGYEAPRAVRPGDRFPVIVYWQWLAADPTSRPVTLTLRARHLPHGASVSTAGFPVGTLLASRQLLEVPDDYRAKKLTLELTWEGTGGRLAHRPAKSFRWHHGAFRLPSIPVRHGTPGLAAPVRFQDGIRLVGLSLPMILRPGNRTLVGLTWECYDTPAWRYRASVQLLTPSLDRLSNEDRPIWHGTRPTTTWQPGEQFPDLVPLWVPRDLPAGGYWLQVSLYDELLRQPLKVIDARGVPVADRWLHGVIASPARLDPLPHRAEVEFGDELVLRGYGLSFADSLRPTQPLTLTLRWAATAPPRADYVLFVHLLRFARDGTERLVTQKDGPPYAGALPTRSWPVGQPLDMVVALQLPEHVPGGRYYLAVGWYDAATGARLPVSGPTELTAGDRVLIDVQGAHSSDRERRERTYGGG